MAGQSRSQNGVASARLCPAIYVLLAHVKKERGCPGSKTSLRGLRKLDRYARA